VFNANLAVFQLYRGACLYSWILLCQIWFTRNFICIFKNSKNL